VECSEDIVVLEEKKIAEWYFSVLKQTVEKNKKMSLIIDCDNSMKYH
jgi:hypothetical protein